MTVRVRIALIRIGGSWTVVAAIADAIAVGVTGIGSRKAGAQGDVAADAVAVRIAGGVRRARVAGVARPVAIAVLLERIGRVGAVVAGVPESVAIDVRLIVSDGRAVVLGAGVGRVAGVAVPVPVGIG